MTLREDWPVHQPEAHDAPIPGRTWYSGCEPAGYDSERGYFGPGPRVNPATCRCEGCGELACPVCGREDCPDHDLLGYRIEQLRERLLDAVAPAVTTVVLWLTRVIKAIRTKGRR